MCYHGNKNMTYKQTNRHLANLYQIRSVSRMGGVKNGGTRRTLKVPGRRLEDRFIFDVMDDVVLP